MSGKDEALKGILEKLKNNIALAIRPKYRGKFIQAGRP
jgi:hypothetical protein